MVASDLGARKPKDRDFLLSKDGMFFCVTGYLHPPDRYTSYLKYSPAPVGKWQDGQTAYRREMPYYHVSQVAETIQYLQGYYPDYVSHCHVRDIDFSLVPRDLVASYFDPQKRLQEILADPRDQLEEQTRGLVNEISSCSGVSARDFGITGSILIGLHNPDFSDIDLVVYGGQNAGRVRSVLGKGECAGIQGPDSDFIRDWARDISGHFPLTVSEADYIFTQRRWNYGFYGKRYFSLHPTRFDSEITEQYGDHIYRSHGTARVRCTVVESAESLFQPAVYRVANIEVLEGDRAASGVGQVVSYEGLYRDLADGGQKIEVLGNLETVDGTDLRLVVGTFKLQGRGYIKPLTNTLQ